MLFNSFIFIIIFLPLCLVGYYIIGHFSHDFAEAFLFAMSLWFYGYNHPPYVIIILASIAFNYAFSRLLISSESVALKKVLLILGIVFNVAVIGYFKYFDFILWNSNTFLHTDFVYGSILLPLGISFYTIQQISYVIDSYRGDAPKYNLIEYALYVTFFPQLVAGPIVYHSELIPQFRNKDNWKVNPEKLLRGIMWFTLGLAKKVFIADVFGRVVDWGFTSVSDMQFADSWAVMFAYTMQIYFDFSGYSDMACGIASMFNLELPQNFNSPYKSLSIRDFWKRWHMTLTRFLTRYIYIPLGGSREGKTRTMVNTLIVFLISGIWHGANYTFILWGLLHGILMILNKQFEKVGQKIPAFVKYPVNFLTIGVLWMLFRASGIKQWIQVLKTMTSFGKASFNISPALIDASRTCMPFGIVCLIAFLICVIPENNYVKRVKIGTVSVIACAGLLALCLLTLNMVSVFLYFNF